MLVEIVIIIEVQRPQVQLESSILIVLLITSPLVIIEIGMKIVVAPNTANLEAIQVGKDVEMLITKLVIDVKSLAETQDFEAKVQ
jgi:hypothetical protein